MIPTNYGSYCNITLNQGFDWSIQLKNSDLSFQLGENKETVKANVSEGTIILKNVAPTALILARNPVFSVNGSVFMKEPYIPNYITLVSGYPTEINGLINFRFDCSTAEVMLLTDFRYSGSFWTEQTITKLSQLYWEIEAIPWMSILTSPLTIIYILSLAIIILVFVLETETTKKIKRNSRRTRSRRRSAR